MTIICLTFVSVKHRGEIVEKALRNSGLPFEEIARRMNHSRRTLYRRLDMADLSFDYIIEIYRIIKRNPTFDFPELQKLIQHLDVKEMADLEQELANLKKEHQHLKDKYLAVLEELNELRKKQQ